MKERGISKAMVENAIHNSNQEQQDEEGLVHFIKKIGNRVLRVVTRKEKK